MTPTQKDSVLQTVRQAYASLAASTATTPACCGPEAQPTAAFETSGLGCCAPAPVGSHRLGYTEEDLATVPAGADLGLGCGNPAAQAGLKLGEVVLDLGAGAGIDCFIAAQRVGPQGRVIGVDMTPEMIYKARGNAQAVNATNVEFRLGEIEHLPLADASVDVVLSNCVINLSPAKPQVFREAFRVLRPGGRLYIADVVALRPLPETVQNDPQFLCGCISGAASISAIEAWMQAAGFVQTQVTVNSASRDYIAEWAPGSGAEDYVASAILQAVKAP